MENLQDATESQIPGPRHEEYQYLDLVREILENGEHRPDRLVTVITSPTEKATHMLTPVSQTEPAQGPTPSSPRAP